MGCGVRPPQGLGIKAVVYEFLVLKISDPLFLQGDDNTYSTVLSNCLQNLGSISPKIRMDKQTDTQTKMFLLKDQFCHKNEAQNKFLRA